MGKALYQKINGKKICTGCHKDQPIGMFGVIKKRNGKHVQKSKCTDCLQQATEYWRKNHRDRYMAYRKKYYKDNLSELRYKHYVADAAIRNRAFNIAKEEFISLFNQPCDYCGGQESLNGVDRLDNQQGYIVGNVVPCCSVCNFMKKKMNKNEFLCWVHKISLHQASLNRREHHA
jgi:hypothetical protein